MSRNFRFTTTFRKNNPDIFFSKTDEGNFTVCLRKSEYNVKLDNLLSDTFTYISKEKNPLKKC